MGDQPARTGRNAEQHHQKEDGWERRDAELPAPFGCAKSHPRDAIVGKISQQYADDDIDLKKAHQSSPQLRRSQFSNVYGSKDGGAANPEPSNEARGKQYVPVPREGTSQGRQNIKDGQEAQRFAPSPFLAGDACRHRANDRADQRHRDGEAQSSGAKPINGRERVRRASDDRRVETKQQTTKRTDDSGFS